MKQLYIYIIFLCCNLGYGQQIVAFENFRADQAFPGSVKYYKDINHLFDKFLGNWKYQNATVNPTVIVEIQFYKQERVDHGGNYFSDEIYGRVKLTKNGQVMYNTLTGVGMSHYLIGISVNQENNSKLFLSYNEPIVPNRHNKCYVDILYAPTTPAQLTWEMDWYKYDETGTAPKMPLDMVLTKIN